VEREYETKTTAIIKFAIEKRESEYELLGSVSNETTIFETKKNEIIE
jgi:hypothetical protein